MTKHDRLLMTARPVKADLERRATALLRREMERKGVPYDELAARLGSNRKAVTTKIARGNFGAWWLIAALDVIGCKTLRIEE